MPDYHMTRQYVSKHTEIHLPHGAIPLNFIPDGGKDPFQGWLYYLIPHKE